MLYPVKIEFKDYPSGSWQDWSEYVNTPPVISKKVESENEGEAGAIVFDSATVTFKYEVGSPVYDAFSIDLSSKQRYLFRISAVKSDKTYVQLYEGIADFSTLGWPGDNLVSVDLTDKLSALNILQNVPVRTLRSLKDNTSNHLPWLVPLDYANGDYYIINVGTGSQVVFEVIKYIHPAFTPQHINVGSTAVVPAGTILKRMEADGDKHLFAKSSYLFEANNPGENDTWLEPSGDSDNITGSFRIDSTDADAYLISDPSVKLKYYKDEFYSSNICNTSYYWDSLGYWKTEVTSFKGEKILQYLINQAWPGILITFRGFSTFDIPYSYWRKTMDENPFNKTPLDALKMLADTMKVYIYVDKTGNVIIQSKSALATSGITRTIGSTNKIKKPRKKYFWDKIVDGVIINVESWVTDETTGESLVGTSELTKQPSGFTSTQKIKPKNSITKDILAGDSSVDTQEELNALAATEALAFLNFYGLRHSSFDMVLNLDDNTIEWELIDNIILSGLTTFFTTLEFDLVERTVKLQPVEIQGHDYDLRQITVGSPEASSSGIGGSSSSGVSSYYGVTPIFNLPLQMSGGIVSLLSTDNLKITSNQLDTIQPIKTTDTPTFNQMLLSAAATLSNHAVRADRNINTSFPLTGGGNLTGDRTLGLSYNATNLKLTSNALNTIQDIATTSSPTFGGMTLNGPITLNTTNTAALNFINTNSTYGKTFSIGVGYPGNYDNFAMFTYDSVFILGYNPDSGGQFWFQKYAMLNAGGEIQNAKDGILNFKIYNTGDYTAAASLLEISTLRSTAGDAYINWNIAWGDGSYFLGIDNSDDDKFKLGITYGFDGGDPNVPITVTRQGKIGLFTQNPSYKLDVAGTGRFTQALQLDTQATATNQALAAGRTISTSYPLIGGGNLTADRTFGLSYNATNLKLTSNALNTIQDIANTSSPTFAGLTINGNILQTTNSYIKNNFTTGWAGSGWQLDYGVSLASKSYLEVDSLTVRGSMKVYELVINQIRATNGSLFVSSTAKVASVGAGTTGDYSLTFEDPEGHGYTPFADNDIIMMQRVDLNGTSVVRYLIGRVLSHSGNTIEFLIQDGTDTPQKGDVFVRIGSTSDATRQGTVYLTSDDTASPYIDIYDGVNNYSLFKTSSVRKVRLGKLTGLTDSDFGSLSGYGLYTTNAYLKGGIWATFGKIAGWTIDTQKLYNGTDIILDATNKKISVKNDAVKMYYTSAADYGIKDSAGKFQLGSTNQIAGWTFDTSSLIKNFNDGTYDYALELRNGSNKGLYLWIDYGYTDLPQMLSFGSYRDYSGGAVSGYGIRYDIGTTTLFQLGTTGNKISAFSFDSSKLTAGMATAGISINTSATAFITGTSAKGFEIYDASNPKLFIGKKDGSYMDYNVVADTLRVSGATVKASSFSTVAGGYDSSNGLVIGIEQGAGLGANLINFNVYTDSTHYGYSYLYGNKETDTGSYPTDLTFNALLSVGSYKYGNYSYHGTTFEIRGNQGVPIIQLRTVVPGSVTQQGGLYIKQDATGGTPVKVVGARVTGWSAATGTATRTSFATSTVTTAQLAQRVKALIDDLISHGLIGS